MAVALMVVCAGCGTARTDASSNAVSVVGAENQYANVLSQIGGQFVHVSAIMTNPNTDPHVFETSPKQAKVISSARLVVQNGLGYDEFMNKLEKATPNSKRKVITVQDVMNLPDSTPNPHLWYDPQVMQRLIPAIVSELSAIDQAHAAEFNANARQLSEALGTWQSLIDAMRGAFAGVAVATTEPIADYLLNAAGLHIATPASFEMAVMNGDDPSPQDVTSERALFTERRVKAFVYNEQVTDSLTNAMKSLAEQNAIPVVGVYETMPANKNYQSWMSDTTAALKNALASA